MARNVVRVAASTPERPLSEWLQIGIEVVQVFKSHNVTLAELKSVWSRLGPLVEMLKDML